MPYYAGLKNQAHYTPEERLRIATGLQTLRDGLHAEIPRRDLSHTILIASWNLRDLGKGKFGGRMKDCHHYMAEIISAFDIVAIQEVGENTKDIDAIMKVLGRWWDCMYSLVSKTQGGNGERLCFMFDTRKVTFQNTVGQIVLPPTKDAAGITQFARVPFLAEFKANWFKFTLTTAHLYYGGTSGAELDRRVKEIETLATTLGDIAEKDVYNTYIVLGDFNVVKEGDRTWKALADNKAGFVIPHALLRDQMNAGEAADTAVLEGSNQNQNMLYDQIAVRPSEFLNDFKQIFNEGDTKSAGVFPMYDYIFKDRTYIKDVDFSAPNKVEAPKPMDPTKARDTEFIEWRSYQMSDHLPKWIKLNINFSDDYLGYLVTL